MVFFLPHAEWSSSLSRISKIKIWASELVYTVFQKLWSLLNPLLFIEVFSNNTFYFKCQSYVKFIKKVVIQVTSIPFYLKVIHFYSLLEFTGWSDIFTFLSFFLYILKKFWCSWLWFTAKTIFVVVIACTIVFHHPIY
jgi:hypothetical protein